MTRAFVQVDPTYENVRATCPFCQALNIYNRRTDLGRLDPIDNATVNCERCGGEFDIGGDFVNTAHEMLLQDCRAFFDEKRYMQTILGVAQAYEVFFNHFMHVRLVYRPCANEVDLDRVNRVAQRLRDKMQRFTFEPMRRLFVQLVLDGCSPATIAEASAYVGRIPDRSRDVAEAGVQAVEALPDERLRELLLALLKTNVNQLRNGVVHKDADRPNRDDTWTAYEEASRVIFGLTAKLRVGGDANFYINGNDDGG